jgi:mannonate dehydratase
MRIAMGSIKALSDERLTFCAQLGVSGVILNSPDLPARRWKDFDLIPNPKAWHFIEIVEQRAYCENYGLKLEAIENTPITFYDKAMLGLPGRDEQIEAYQETIRALGQAGVPILGYHWMPNAVWRTSFKTPGRGGAQVSSFDMDLVENAPLTHGRVYEADELWGHYEYFLRAVLPVAEEAGVTLALHPDDPPVPSLGGVARLFSNFDGFKRAMEIVPSPNHGLDLCLGCWSEMGENLPAVIDYFGTRGKIIYVHFRDVQGGATKFQECFLGEGNYDPLQIMLALKRSGFDGFIIDDHVPHMIDDTDWCHRGRGFQTGYLLGLLSAVQTMS